jgi:5-methylthioadenosine/S-adenosylhomocysteine deaminase
VIMGALRVEFYGCLGVMESFLDFADVKQTGGQARMSGPVVRVLGEKLLQFLGGSAILCHIDQAHSSLQTFHLRGVRPAGLSHPLAGSRLWRTNVLDVHQRFLILFLLFSLGSVRAEEVDLLVRAGIVVTMDQERTLLAPGYVAVREGKIVDVGEGRSVHRAQVVLEAPDKVVVPGLVNCHTHLPMVLFRGLADDLVIDDWLRKVIFPAEAANVDRDFVAVGTRLGLAELIRGGVTTYADMYYFEDTIAQETRQAGMRAVLGQTVLDFPAPDFKTWEQMMSATREFAEKWQDDTLITPAIAPHAPYTVKPEHWRDVSELAEQLDIPIVTHLAEAPMEVEHTLTHYQKRPIPFLEDLGLLSPRLLAAHAIYVDDSEARTLATKGVGVSHCPESNMKVAVGVSPVPDLLEAGVRVGLGTDGAASNNNLDMWQEMDSAAKLHKMYRLDPTTMPAQTVFGLATIGGAQALHMENEIGSLEKGKAADMILLDLDQPHLRPLYNIYSQLVYAVRAGDVTDTIVAGRFLMRDRRLLVLDEESLKRDVEIYRNQILQSLKVESVP